MIGMADDVRMSDKPVWRIEIADSCIGSGSCLGAAPGRFVLGADNLSRPVHTESGEDEAVLDAAASCPMEAITIYNLTTGEQIEP